MSIILTLAATLAAQATESAPEDNPSWTTDTITVRGESITGYGAETSGLSRSSAALIDVPQSIQVLTPTLLREQELTTLTDALANISGAVPADTREGVLANPSLRGFEAEIFIDGLIAYADTAVIDPSSLIAVERIEVAKGPTSALFGGGTGAPVGGLINLVTKTPGQEADYEIGVRLGSEETVALFADLNQPLGDQAGVRLAAEHFSSADYIDAVETTRLTLNPSVAVSLGANTDLVVRGLYNRIEQLEYSGLPASVANLPGVDPFQFTGATDAPDTVIENTMVTAELTHAFSDTLSGQMRLRRYESRFDEFASFGFFAFFPITGTQMPVIRGHLPVDVGETTVDGALSWSGLTGSIRHDVLIGATYDATDYDGATAFDFTPIGVLDLASGVNALQFGAVPAITREIVSEYRTTAIYAQNQMQIGDRLSVLASGRFSSYTLTEVVGGQGTDETYDEFDPRLGASLRVVDGLSVFAGWATGSRLSLFFAGENGAAPVPETSESIEAGVKFNHAASGLSGTLAVFEITRENVPTASPIVPFTQVQTGEQQSQGVELDLVWEPSEQVSFLMSAASIDAEVTRDNTIAVGDALPRTPDLSMRIAGRYRVTDGRFAGLGVGAGVTHNGDASLALPNGARSDSYTIADAQVSFERDNWRIGFDIENLFDEDYFAPYQYLAQDVVRPGRPRSAWVSLSTRF